MVDSVEPAYYATAEAARVVMHGHGFENLPVGFKAFISYSNNGPTMYYGNGSYEMIIESVTSDTIVMSREPFSSTHEFYYVGCIGNADNTEVLWINDAKPLP